MAVSYSLFKIRLSGVLQILLGLFILAVGIADHYELTEYLSGFPARYVLAIWMGCWILITGVVCVFQRLREDFFRKSEVIVYVVFTAISLVFAIALLACYSVSIGLIAHNEGSCTGLLAPEKCPIESPYDKITLEKECDIRIKLAVIIMFLSFLEFLVVIWTVCLCHHFFTREQSIAQSVEKQDESIPIQLTSTIQVNMRPISKLRPVSIVLTSNQEPAESPPSFF